MSSYGNRSKSREDRIIRLIETDIYCCQSSLVDSLLKSGEMDGWTTDDIEGLYVDPSEWDAKQCQDFAAEYGIELPEDDDYLKDHLEAMQDAIRDNAEPREPYEWWAVSKALCEEMRELGEIVIDNDFGYWWGRQTTGQSIEMDGVWDQWCDMREVE